MEARNSQFDEVCQVGESLIQNNHYAKRDIKIRINSLKEKWHKLRDLADKRRIQLEDAYESHQVRLTSVFLKCLSYDQSASNHH